MAPHPGCTPKVVALGALVAALVAPALVRAQDSGPAPEEPVGVTLDWPQSQPTSGPASQPSTVPAITDFQTAPEPPPPRSGPPDVHTLPRGFGLGVYALGYFPVGSWIDHPYAGTIAPSDLDYFGPGGGAALELLIRYKRVNFILARGDVGRLSSTAWEHWTEQHGGGVTVRTLAWGVHTGFGGVLWDFGRSRLEADALLGAIGFHGRETDPRYDVSYPLNFLHPAFSLRVRVAAAFAMVRSLELYGAFEAGFAFPTMTATDGGGPTATLSLALGVRFWGALLRGRR
jgi:hypothetical protein